jgi:cation diffusion facilitator CzcD-associated flavoprotein CzcO
VVLEALETSAAPGWTHTYPGIRSDSDLYTFGYRFKPWTGPPIATAERDPHLHGRGDRRERPRPPHPLPAPHRPARWSSDDNRWTLDVTRTDTGEQLRFTCGFLWMCQGYYRHSEGYTPEWPGMDRLHGPHRAPADVARRPRLHRQEGVVIGSGATAATLVPAIADAASTSPCCSARRPTSGPDRNANELADTLRELEVDESGSTRSPVARCCTTRRPITRLSFEQPEFLREELLEGRPQHLGPTTTSRRTSRPTYRPWQQRIAFVPDGDLFAGIREGKASMVTDEIETFTETGIRTEVAVRSWTADIIITATGFDLSVLGDIEFTIDDEPLVFSDTVTYRGMMFTGVPNMVWVFGYFRASWTLRADLIATSSAGCSATWTKGSDAAWCRSCARRDADMKMLPWVDENFNPNYLMRSMHLLPKRGDKPEWQHTQDYWTEKDALPAADLDDGCLRYD